MWFYLVVGTTLVLCVSTALGVRQSGDLRRLLLWAGFNYLTGSWIQQFGRAVPENTRLYGFLLNRSRAFMMCIYLLLRFLWTCLVTATFFFFIPATIAYTRTIFNTPETMQSNTPPSLRHLSPTPTKLDTGVVMGISITSTVLSPQAW